ncbi:MAG: alcohol dehydrogenase [Beggiatoa sp. IS2]|nr:MAG: alcohol dehydrogenase [Beggiatoa sp. IS2]
MLAYSPKSKGLPVRPFAIARLPRLIFGEGSLTQLSAQVASYGHRALVITGACSFQTTPHWTKLQQQLREQQIEWETFSVQYEPSPDLVDTAVQQYRHQNIEVVVGIGGGSVLDAAKAIAGLLPYGNSVMDHLEGIGKNIPYQGPATPFIAVPTTAGTGSEATKNAVLSQLGEQGFKKSFRHDALVSQVAIVDPTLLASCPAPLIAANGMDAFTQLLESYVSINANPLTDALALSGITAFRDGFFPVWEGQESDKVAIGRTQLAYASLLSGITLAQTGLGSVHGLASPLGAFFPCPHGVVCGTLVAEATAINIQALQQRQPNNIALTKYAQIGLLLTHRSIEIVLSETEQQTLLDHLVMLLRQWTEQLALPKLSQYGMQSTQIDKVVAHCRGGSMKTNPLILTDAEIAELLYRRL